MVAKSGSFLGDGRCTFDIVIQGRRNFESTTGAELGRAAWKLMNECVRDQGGQGGVLSNLGKNKFASPLFPPIPQLLLFKRAIRPHKNQRREQYQAKLFASFNLRSRP